MIHGSIVALITPFRDGRLDEEALTKMVEWHIGQGTHGIVPVGTTGESPTLSHDEHCRVIELVVQQAAGRVPVIAGAGSNNPIEAIEYTRVAEKAGADATLHVAGYYNRPNQDGLYHHFKMVHDETNIPIILYNIPPRAIVDIQPQTMARLAELPRIIGVKDATGDLSRPWSERQLIKKPFVWLSGEDATAVAYNIGGGTGCISVTANVAPRQMAELCRAAIAGDVQAARRINDPLQGLHKDLFCEANPIPVKWALERMSRIPAGIRLPLTRLSDAGQSKVEAALKAANLI